MNDAIKNAPDVREGDILEGKYRVERVLGVGGMGVVVAAHHLQLDEKVAIKFLLQSMLANSEAVSRFSREARAAVKIKSEHVARVFDVGVLDNGAPYMVMEYLDGGDLAGWVRQHGPLPIEQAVEFVLQACVAVAEAHVLGIVHRDLKPANLFCLRGADGRLTIKVLDFGISKSPAGAAGAACTNTHTVMGTPLYMSPEQMTSAKSVDARADIWALGIVLFELMTGEMPFHGDSMPEIVVKIATATPTPIREYRPEVPEALEGVLLRCLQKAPAARYADVAELAVALLPFAPPHANVYVERIGRIVGAGGMSTPAPGPAPQSAPQPRGPGTTEPTPEPKWKRTTSSPALSGTLTGAKEARRRGGRIVGALALVGVVAVTGAVYGVVGMNRPSSGAEVLKADVPAAPPVVERAEAVTPATDAGAAATSPFGEAHAWTPVVMQTARPAALAVTATTPPARQAPNAARARLAGAIPSTPSAPPASMQASSARPGDPNALFGLQPK